ncbi:MAG TPA: hypothetical protein VK528_06760 [Flavobacterium sp.]|nr:hypothetical protein [Flavobacterium sp.]
MDKTLRLILCYILFMACSICNSQVTNTDFGTQTSKEIDLPSEFNTVINVEMQRMMAKEERNFFQENNPDESFWIDSKPLKWKVKKDTANKLEITVIPMKPNRFYRIRVSYYSTNTMYAIMRMIDKEGIDNWYTAPKNWMKAVDLLDLRYKQFTFAYVPSYEEVQNFKAGLDAFKLNSLDDAQKAKLKEHALKCFRNLNFKSSEIDNKKLADYANLIYNATSIGQAELLALEDMVIKVNDYQGIYDFYAEYFKPYLANHEFDSQDYIAFFNRSVLAKELSVTGSDLIPNYLYVIKEEILYAETATSTFAETFEKSYKRAIVADFGYVAFANFDDDLTGGNLFLGINIQLQPVNKNTPLRLSALTFGQRVSIHTGFLINSLKKDYVREDFFKDNSLLLGASYKILAQALRINLGGVFYKKIDPLTASKKVAIQPYIGLSIDLEIRAWLIQTFPSLTTIF